MQPRARGGRDIRNPRRAFRRRARRAQRPPSGGVGDGENGGAGGETAGFNRRPFDPRVAAIDGKHFHLRDDRADAHGFDAAVAREQQFAARAEAGENAAPILAADFAR